MRHMDPQTFSAILIDYGQAPEGPTICERVAYEIHAPALVWTPERLSHRPGCLAPAPFALPPHSKPFGAVEALYPLSVYRPPLAPKQQVSAPISPSWELRGKLPYARAELLLRLSQAPVAHARARKTSKPDRPTLRNAVCGLDLLDDAPPLASRHYLFPNRSFSTWRFRA